ncbi:hypothetical protein Q73A0000_05810 [Kaistella flava (ex Peng et al. 2021)]|uniref:Uncharacterized protein n=1 Tax=Kaistella flava (ex Peng et al. 2021) TaxID=2038776 RepID=A0A7M2Y7V9_9FLAO|nr:hypothetical protein [Kaistella flava (ex Peng et al. 2021)]QOW09909.1 hypothetical protein Q73A0000_05810 [Kaistella flava (ex Peng et al. 2021)]
MKQSKNIISFFERVIEDDRLNPSHISMYVSLFQLWSLNRFQNPFRICREEVMKLGKIKSIATYHKCIRELYEAEFIIYLPSYDSYKGSLIEIIDFESEQADRNRLLINRKLLSKVEISFSVPMRYEVELYFNERDLPSTTADQFYSSYQSTNWKLSNNKPMKYWQAAARNWISKLNKAQDHSG